MHDCDLPFLAAVQSYSEGSEDEQDREEGEDGEGEGTSAGGSKVRSSGLVVPLGWPKVKI